MTDLPKSVRIMEVSPRDGLQIEPRILSTDQKVELIGQLADSGLREIEAGSFVHQQKVPQMADAEELFRRLPPKDGVEYHALWLNAKGLQRALATPNVTVIGKVLVTASDTFSKRNTNKTIDETLAAIPEWIAEYKNANIPTEELRIPAAFGCNYEGYISVPKVVALVERSIRMIADHGETIRHLSFSDTMGWGNPLQTKRLVGSIRERFPGLSIRLHLHDTRGTAIANAAAALELGVANFDAAVGALGGCPFAAHNGAAGNVSTEDLVFLCEEMGIETGVDLDRLIEAARFAENAVGHDLPGKLMKAGSLARFRSQRAAANAA